MATLSVTNISELKGTRRLDAEYYQPIYLKLEKELLKVECKRLKNMAFVTDGIHSSIEYDPNSRIRIISAQSVRDNDFDLSANTRISVEQHQRNLRTSLKIDDIILSSVGTIGNTAVVSADMLPSNADRHVGIVRLRDRKFNAFYVSTFLNSKYGRFQTFRESTGNVQLNLFIEKIEQLLIPEIKNAGQIGKTTEQATMLLGDSRNLYSKAENLLLEELGLKDFKPKYELSYTATLSKAFGIHRVDAEYFQPSYDGIESHLRNKFDAVPIRKMSFIEVTTGQYCEEYVSKSEGAPYIRGADISNGTIRMDDLVYIASNNQDPHKKALEGDVVVTRVGTIGLSARIPKECEGGTISDNLIRLRFNNDRLNSYYLALFLGCPIGISLMIRNSRGSVQQRLNQETLKEVIVPILQYKTQREIALLIQQSHEARRKAKQLLEEAKSEVENLIEGRA